MLTTLALLIHLLTPYAFALPTEFKGRSALGEPLFMKVSDATLGAVVLFLSAKCPCSASHEADLAKLYREFSKSGFQFIGIHSNSDEPKALSQAHFQAVRLPFAVLEDPDSTLADAFHAYKTPHAFVVSPKGEIVFQGGVDNSHLASEADQHYLREALMAVSRHQTPNPSEVRALGCVIKRKKT
jgi:peroxiredoxin